MAEEDATWMQVSCPHICLHSSYSPFSPLHPTSDPREAPNTQGIEHFFKDKRQRSWSAENLSSCFLPLILPDKKEEVWEECYMKLLQLVLNCKPYPHSYKAQRKLSLHTASLLQLHCSGYAEPSIASLLTTTIDMVFPYRRVFQIPEKLFLLWSNPHLNTAFLKWETGIWKHSSDKCFEFLWNDAKPDSYLMHFCSLVLDFILSSFLASI